MKRYLLFLLMALFSSTGFILPGCNNEVVIPDDPDGEEKPDTISYNLNVFPEGSEPEVIGKQLVRRFIQVPYSFWGNINSQNTPDHVTYPDVCAWLGALWFADKVADEELYNGLVGKFEPLFTTDKAMQPSLRPSAANIVDYYVFGAVPLEIYKKKKEARYLELGMKYADGQWTLPTNATQTQTDWHKDGFSWQTRLWIDDMFMITALQARAYYATNDTKYMDRTAREMVLYLDRIQNSNGLFYHAPNAPFYWARGDGWMAVGMAEVLKMLPDNHADKPRIKAAYLKMMETLARFQLSNGMWAQLIDNLSAWPESSGSAMFTYAMITGVKEGWLEEKKYGAVARKGWLALLTYLTDDYDLREVCEGTGAKNDYQYYINRRRWVGDLHGQAALMWCANALSTPADSIN